MEVSKMSKWVSLIAGVVLLSACGDDSTAPIITAPEVHECTIYEPTLMSGIDSGTWTQSSGTYPYELNLTMPSDPGGGHLILKLEVFGIIAENERSPWINAFTGDGTGAITSGASQGYSVREVAFSVAPSQTYQVELYNFFYQENLDYTFTWEFTGAMDCYEQNDGLEVADGMLAAKQIPTDTLLEAFVLPQYVTNYLPMQDNSYDWYKFTLAKDSNITFEIVQSPSNAQMEQWLIDASGTKLTSIIAPAVGTPYVSDEFDLEAGTYYLQVWEDSTADYAPVLSDSPNTPSDGESLPDSFNTPYKFMVNTVAQ